RRATRHAAGVPATSGGDARSRSEPPMRLRALRWMFVLAGATALRTPPCPADPYPRQPGVDVIHYAFRLALRDETDEIEGTATIDVKFLEDGLADLALDLASPASGKGMTVSTVTCRGEAAKFDHNADRLRIRLAPSPRSGERRTFTVTYCGVPASGL